MKRLTAVIVLMFAQIATADVIPEPRNVERPSRPVPVGVTMSAEDVNVRIERDVAAVEATFTLTNVEESSTVEVGFPGRSRSELGSFAVLVDGEPVRVREEPARLRLSSGRVLDDGSSIWKLWSMTFAKSQTRRVLVSYVTPIKTLPGGISLQSETSPWWKDEGARIRDLFSFRYVSYVLWTGSYWKGPVGRCRMKIDLGDVSPNQIAATSPKGGSVADGRIVWDLRDYEPNGELSVEWTVQTKEAARREIEGLLRKHPRDVFLKRAAGEWIAHQGSDPIRRIEIYRDAFDRWNGRIPPSTEQTPEARGVDTLWEIAQVLIREYDTRGMTEEAKAVAPRIAPLAASRLQRLRDHRFSSGRFHLWEDAVAETEATLDLCRKYGAAIRK